jgi:transposase
MMTDGAAEPGWVGSYRRYECPCRDQMTLMPVSMRDWLPEEHLVWFVLEAVERMDTRALHTRVCEVPGRRPYLPEMMLGLLLYAYCGGIRSSRQIEGLCVTDAAFRVICGGLFPDHATIARFVACHEAALEGLFVEGVRLCAAAGLADPSVLALDGTKIAADASLSKNRDAGWIAQEIAALMAVTVASSAGLERSLSDAIGEVPSDRPGDPGGEATRPVNAPAGGRLGRLSGALAVIDAAEQHAREAAQQSAQAAITAAQRGYQLTGRKPKDPHAGLQRARIDLQVATERLERLERARATGPRPRDAKDRQRQRVTISKARGAVKRARAALTDLQAAVKDAAALASRANVTDPDSRIMRTRHGWVQGYNAQAIVNSHQIVLAVDVSQDASDAGLYQSMIATLTNTLSRARITTDPGLVLADAGYWSAQNATSPGPDRLIATMKDHKQRAAARQLGTTNGPPPPGLSAIQEMEHLLRTPQGASAYRQRSSLIEPVFGDHKHNHHIRQFRRRGLPATRSEWAFIQLAGNLRKLHRHQLAIA